MVIMATETSNLPWVEKHRPKTLDDLIAHTDIINTIGRFIEQQNLPHLLFYGPPGTGKTSTILACAKQLYTPNEMNAMVLELNASDDRGINIVRGDILNFAEARPVFNKGFKLVILDEADAMTNDAQNALRRIMEKYTNITRFCIICNYLSKIIPALQSRCTRFRFAPLHASQIKPRLELIIQMESVKATPDGINALIDLSNGDMRRIINGLQSTHMSLGEVNSDSVYKCFGQPTRDDINQISKVLIDDTDLSANYTKLLELQTLKGLALQDLITRLHDFVHEMPELTDDMKVNLLEALADIEMQLALGGNEKIQSAAVAAAFFEAALIIWKD